MQNIEAQIEELKTQISAIDKKIPSRQNFYDCF